MELVLTHVDTKNTEVIIGDCVSEMEAKIDRFCNQVGWTDECYWVRISVDANELYGRGRSTARLWFNRVSSACARPKNLNDDIAEFRFVWDTPSNITAFIKSMCTYTDVHSTVRVHLHLLGARYNVPRYFQGFGYIGSKKEIVNEEIQEKEHLT